MADPFVSFYNTFMQKMFLGSAIGEEARVSYFGFIWHVSHNKLDSLEV